MSELPPAGNPDPTQAYPSPGAVLAAAPPPPRRLDWRRGALLGGVIALIALSGLAVLIWLGWNIGPVALAIGIVAAVLPVPLLAFCFLWLDRYEPEPVKYLAFCFGWGACVATGAAILVNTGASRLFTRWGLPDALVAVFIAPFIEETMKALGPILLFALRRRAFSGMIDAIVYCGLSATGFAMVENILYLGGHGYAANADENGPLAGASAVVAIFIARILMSGFAHPLFTSMTGIGLGVAARAGDRRVRWLAPLAGLIVAMMLHGTWNLMSTLAAQSQQGWVLLYGYFAVMMPIFFGMVGFALWLRGSEGRLTERIVGEYARSGWFSPPEAAALGTLGRRLAARRWAKRVAGDAGAKAMRAYQFDATRLALLRDGMNRGVGLAPDEVADTLAEERRLLDAIDAYRKVFAGRDPYAPRAVWDGGRYHVTFPDGAVRALDAPQQPVVPVPVVLVPAAPPPGHPAPGYPWPSHPGPGFPGYR
ncbi:PrsW family intramembrane metalloprotease [Planosporangium flavigriseum]|uniref:Protease PrsW n=1 Tax=Planosporangium flavigriseum TaxID=373681 RepID=A0A8J3PKQ7_9ACTN|nr:PrsW family intramembrane metalloprotease [Planosporangium flavigriseum]NJC63692.1 PrsW family intramembrane metalloprotease [Planosporangium flavigriseum]GIG72394.1 protease PrsW [Planosporangium flavigriseum]